MEFQQNKKSRLDISLNTIQSRRSTSPAGTSSRLSAGSASGPYRGQYSRLSLGATNSTSRFSPYSLSRDRPSSRRSIPVIRARRDDDASSTSSRESYASSNFGSASSTAQKIMETLASMSTPVLNAGRVRIDSIKSVKPTTMGSSFLNTTGESFLSSTSKFNGPPKTSTPLLLPKSGTGVRPEFESCNWPVKCLSIAPKTVDCGTNTDDLPILNDKNGNTSSTTSSPTTTNVNAKSTDKNPSYLQLQLTGSERTRTTNDSNPIVPFANGEFTFNQPWTLEEVDKCLGSKPFKSIAEEKSSSSSSDSDEENETINSEEKKFNRNIPNGDFKRQSPIKPDQSQNKSKVTAVSVLATPAGTSAVISEKRWECPVCMVQNKSSDTKCVCCMAPNPTAKSSTDKTDSNINKSAPTAKNWTCPTCMVPNKAESSACVCCAEPNPNPVAANMAKTPVDETPPVPSFQFGFKSSSPSVATTSSSGNFLFGGTSSVTKSSDSNATSGFTFGFKSSANTPSSPSTTAVASSLSSPPQPQIASISSQSAAGTGFIFGAKTTTTPNTSISTVSTSLSAGNSVQLSSTISNSPKKIELWECNVCPNRNKIELYNCATCDSPRPRELDSNYKKPEEKPKSDLKFEPIFGGLKSTSQTFSAPPPSIFSSGATSSAISGFGSTSSFSSGNPFGGASNFGSGTSAPLGTALEKNVVPQPQSGFSTPSSSVLPTTTTISSSFNSTTSSTTNTFSGFQFGAVSSNSPPKRKHDDDQDDSASSKKAVTFPSATFSFGSSSSNPPLKLKENTIVQPPPSAASPAPVNNAGFLEALKNASAAVKASVSTDKLGGTQTLEPTKPFQFGSSGFQSSAPSFAIGSTPTTNPAPAFSFGNNSTLGQASGQVPPVPNTGLTPVTVAASSQFNLAPTNFNFGATAASPGSTTFSFGGAPPNNPAGGIGNAPGFNFGGASSGAPSNPPSFEFSSNPSSAGGSNMEQRKIKRATRRFNVNR